MSGTAFILICLGVAALVVVVAVVVVVVIESRGRRWQERPPVDESEVGSFIDTSDSTPSPY